MRASESVDAIYGGDEGQGDHGAHTRHGHQAMSGDVLGSQLRKKAIDGVELIIEGERTG
jgi:hypothetical protein